MYERKRKSWQKHIDFILIDILCLQLAFVFTYFLRFSVENPYANPAYRSLAGIYILTDLLVAIMFDSFKNVLHRGYYKELLAVIRHNCMLQAIMLLYMFATKRSAYYSRVFVFSMTVIYLILTYVSRCLTKLYLTKRKQRGKRSLLIVAPREKIEECIQSICDRNYLSYQKIVAVVSDEALQGTFVEKIPVVACYEGIVSYIQRNWVDEVFLCGDTFQTQHNELLEQLKQMGVVTHLVVTRCSSLLPGKQQIRQLGDYMVVTTSLGSASAFDLYLKRALDIVGSLIGCLCTVLLTLVIGPMIYISSPGPIFFAQERIGKNGKRFIMYKFRTMYPDAEERKAELMKNNRIDNELMFKMEYDPRIIGNRILPDGTIREGLGSFLRKTSLDEFPQFFNVLRGDMSLVGTRPPTVDEWEKYDLHHRARLACRPGITGLWQVSGRSQITDFEEVVRLDTEYIDHWNFGTDLRILFKTVGVLVRREGAL